MKSERAIQVFLLAAGLVFFLVGILRGEAATVLSKAMKSEKVTQILLLAAGLVFFLVGIFRGEAAVVLSKAIKLCMECVGIG